eukprot:TRINITY_DN702_c0_g1_i1.p1 TRINITY_DN702_c0_g1~~TRINITY_DN702_c0_g1_i1.p1  ORF type:complete len:709 (-),score=147.55 TRINITY_DN702_c0_g1_i1:75-2144(-)
MAGYALDSIADLRDATRAGAGYYFDFASGKAKPGRKWHKNAPESVRAELCRDISQEERKLCCEVSRIDKVQPVAEGSSPVVLIIIGPSGAGKSMVLPKAAKFFGLDLNDFAEVDGDSMRGCHGGWKTHVVDDMANGYFDAYDIYITNKTNKGLKLHYLQETLNARKNVIYPDTHVKKEDLALMKEKGYKVYTLGLLISCCESDCRQKNRAETNGRWSGTPMEKWEVTVKDVVKMCAENNSDKALVYESTDVLNPRLVYARGLAGVQEQDDLQATVDRLKIDGDLMHLKQCSDHAWCECLSLAGCYSRPDAGNIYIRLKDYSEEVSEVDFGSALVSDAKCVFAVKTCTLHRAVETKKKDSFWCRMDRANIFCWGRPEAREKGTVGEEIGCFSPVSLSIQWNESAPWGRATWKLESKIAGHSIKQAIREDDKLLSSLKEGYDGSDDCLNFCAAKFRKMTSTEWNDALQACKVTGTECAPSREAPKALIVMAPSAGGKTTVVTMLADSFGIDIDKSVRADGAIFRDYHKQYAMVCENGVANDGLWYNAWPAAKSIVQKAKVDVLKDAMNNKQDLVISDTGAEVDRLEELVASLKGGGYLVSLVGIYADPKAILQRGIAREIGEGKRYNRSIDKLKQTFEHFGAAISVVDGPFKIVHNAQGQKPQVTLEGNGCNGGQLPKDVAEALEKLVSQL